MQIHNVNRTTQLHKAKRIGRGGKRGTYSGRGIKGQHARAGAKFFPEEREILKKIPKLRGWKFKSFQTEHAVVNMSLIERKFKTGDTISPASLHAARLVRTIKGGVPKVKILGKSTSTKKFVFKDVAMSRTVAATVQTKAK